MKDPERCQHNQEIENRISPLVEAFNKCTNTRTFSSCQGHFGFEEPKPVSGKSYVEFRMPQDKFRELEQATYNSINGGRCSIWFDQYITGDAYFYGCVYVIPDEDLGPEEQRQVADEAICRLAAIIEKL
ncbi:MAG: hypothetical protein OEZ00_05105 [Dehalococcoidia bacterium]|nr:hypothetical protein [Dehalococcoidia bacterium]